MVKGVGRSLNCLSGLFLLRWKSLSYLTAHRTPLHAAAFADNVSGLRMLLQHQAEVNATDHTGRTALMTAAENGQTAAMGVYKPFVEERNSPGVFARWISPAFGVQEAGDMSLGVSLSADGMQSVCR